MLEIEEMSRKYSRTYRCPDDINYFKLRVRLKDVGTNYEELQVFSWQEKKFSKHERDFYKDSKNCFTELEKTYHEEVKLLNETGDVIFSYADADGYEPEQKIVSSANLNDFMQKLAIGEENSCNARDYSYEESLINSINKPFCLNNYEYMYILGDFGECYDNTWIKCEYVLCVLRYDKVQGILVIYPDYTLLEPYVVNINTDSSRKIEYYLENPTLDGINGHELIKEAQLFNKVANLETKIKSEGIDTMIFKTPRDNKLYVLLHLEIVKAENFEDNPLYVQYFIDLPNSWSCDNNDMLKGMTPSCVFRKNRAYYGFPFEIFLECDVQNLQNEGFIKSPYIYFELISKGSWDRYRTEGLTFQRIPIFEPGLHKKRLQCVRLGGGSLSEKLRRFFVGDCGSCADISWTAIPKTHEGRTINKISTDTIGSGQLEVKLSIIHQSHALAEFAKGKSRERVLLEKLRDSNLIRSVEQVVDAFKKARKDLLQARNSRKKL